MFFWVSATNGSAGGDGSQDDPFLTIEQAQQAVRTVLQAPGPLDEDIVVNIGAGTYQLQNPLSFGAADSGRDGHVVHYRAVAGEHPVISGGMAVDDWTPVANPGLALAPGMQLWQATVGPGVDSRQLYVDGERATRAETNADTASSYPVGFRPSFEEDPGVSGIKYATDISDNPNSPNWSDPTTWTNVQDVEAVIYSQWKMAAVPLQSVSAADSVTDIGLIELSPQAWTNANLIRNAPLVQTISGSTTITLTDGDTSNHLAQVDTYIGQIKPGMIVSSTALPDGQVVRVVSVDTLAKTVTLDVGADTTTTATQPAGMSFFDPTTRTSVTTAPAEWAFWRVSKFENAYQFLDQKNEWYLDKTSGTLYLVSDSDPNGKDIQLPLLETLAEGNGASNLSFEGLAFKYATWLPGWTDGYVADQSAFRVTGAGHDPNNIGHFEEVTRTPGNVSFTDAKNVTFEGNTFSHLGGVGLDLAGGAQDNRVAYNIFTDISSSAVVLGGVSAADARPATSTGVVRDNEIVGNYIAKVGAEYYDAAGIFVGYSKNATVSGNFITDTPWAGIAIGWGWGLRDEGGFPGLTQAVPDMWGTNATPTIMEGNRITDNTITRFLQQLWDGGAIYTTGFQDGDVSDGLNGTVIARNNAFNKTPGAGSNVFYTDGGSRFLELDGNISFGNDQGYADFGPAFAANDTLNASSPLKCLPLLNDWFTYGSDIGGCVTYGDILYLNNQWQNLWGSLQPVWNSSQPGSDIRQLFEELIFYSLLVKENYADWPATPLYFDPGQYTDTSGTVYPTGLQFLSNAIIDGVGSINSTLLDNFATTSNTLSFTNQTPIVASRADDLGGQVSFGLFSLANGSTTSVLDNALGRSAEALAYGNPTEGNWLLTEGQSQGGISSSPVSLGAGVWLPTATLDGLVPLDVTSVTIDGNSAFATFEGGYEATFTFGGSRSIPTVDIIDNVAVTVQRLAGYSNGLAFYEADATTGRIQVNGNALDPGDADYLQGALANARAAGLVIDASRLPDFGGSVTLDDLPLNDARSYGLLVLIDNDPNALYSSYSAANPGGATQIMAFGDPGTGITFGIEDILVTSGLSDRDYNDLIVQFRPVDLQA